MNRPLTLAILLLLPVAGCGPRVQPLPPPAGGYATLIPNRTVQVATARGVTVQLPAGTTLAADSSINGETVFCGPVYVGGISERLCLARRQGNCLSADGTGPLACFPRGTFTLAYPQQTPASEVAAEMGLGFND